MEDHTYFVGKSGVLVHNDCTGESMGKVEKWAQKTNENIASKKEAGFNKWLNKGSADNKVYFGVDKAGDARYTGITKQSTSARLNQHINNGKPFVNLDVQYEGLTRNQARAVEQYFIENGPNEFNKINSISKNHRYYSQAKTWAEGFLGVQ